jgi:hypothetical protein
MNILAILIQILHILLIVFVIVTPFVAPTLSKDQAVPYLVMHIAVSLSLLVHWALNDSTCALTIAECYVRGVPVTDSFMHRLVSPVYVISDQKLGTCSWWSTIILILISVFELGSMALKTCV